MLSCMVMVPSMGCGHPSGSPRSPAGPAGYRCPMLIDFASITPKTVAALTERLVAEGHQAIEALVAVAGSRTYDNNLRPMDVIEAALADHFGVGPFVGYVHPDPEVRAAARRSEEALSKWVLEVAFRPDLYEAVDEFARSPEGEALEGEPARFLAFTMRDFRKAGHELDPEARDQLRRISQRLIELSVAFEQNIADHRDHLTVTAEDLIGLPPGYIDRLRPGPADGTFEITMAYPDVIPFMDNAVRRDLREALAFKFNNRAVEPNRPILEEAARLRRRVARLFGVPSWAHHRMDDRMAKTPERVEAFYAGLLPALTAKGHEELEAMAKLLAEDTGETALRPWDWRYYDTQLRKRDYGVDPAEVAPYFPLQRVLGGLFEVTGDVFGLDYVEMTGEPTWHPDVQAFAVRDRDSGRSIGAFYMDLFPREGKFSHAAAFPLVPGRRRDGTYQRPISAIVANFTKPTGDQPSLLLHDEVVTLFHEFGHILHQVLTQVEMTRFSGSNTERDFVEAPSQIMEHWTWSAPVLARFARHHLTDEPIPPELVDRLVAARNLNVGLTTLRQIGLGMFDLALHGPDPDRDLDEIHRTSAAVGLLPLQEGTFAPASFGHLMGGYDAGYYGYLWSEVYGDDMFSRFESAGGVDPAVGAEYRRLILERGGSLDGMELLRDFLGREPDNRAFLRKRGIS